MSKQAEAEAMDDRAKSLARMAFLLATLALIASFFFGWLLPLAIYAVSVAMRALRAPYARVRLARWALGFGILASVFSIGWLVWVWMQLTLGG